MLFNPREHKILQHLLAGDDRTWIIIQYDSSSEELDRIHEKFEDAMSRSDRFVPTFALGDNCDILCNGSPINHCSQLHGDEPSDSNWKQIEDSCLLCLVYQNTWDLNTSIEELADSVSDFFGRTPGAINQRVYALLRRNKKPLYLAEGIWNELKN